MADVFSFRRSQGPRIDRLMQSMESICRVHDSRITYCIWVVVCLLIWCVIAPGVGETTQYTGAFDPGPVSNARDMSRAGTRRLHRVARLLSDRCQVSDDPFVLGPQVSVDQAPYMYDVIQLCAYKKTLLNAKVIVAGTGSGTCLDGLSRRIVRPFPVTIRYEVLSGGNESLSLLTLKEVCPVLYAIDLLSGKWSV